MTDHGERLRQAREAAGYSLSTMARLTNFSKAHLANVERGCRRATAQVVVAYEKVLGEDMRRRELVTGVAAAVIAPAVVTDLIRRGFAAALSARVGADEWMRRVEEYGRDYMSVGAEDLRSRLAADLIVLQQQLESPTLWSAAARTLTVFGKTIKGAREASRWYLMAAEAADRSGDAATRVWTRGRSALAALPPERHSLSLTLMMAEIENVARR